MQFGFAALKKRKILTGGCPRRRKSTTWWELTGIWDYYFLRVRIEIVLELDASLKWNNSNIWQQPVTVQR